jgi:succinate dehydrogenase / fumarate reductase flavoprotein subunit
LAQVSVNIIDQCVAQGVPFGREYGGLLDNRSFGGAQVSRTFYARGQTGQQLQIGAYQALSRQVATGQVEMHSKTEMLDLVVHDGRARGIVTRDMVSGEIRSWSADAVVLATGGYSNVFFLSTNAKGCNGTAIWRAHRRGAWFANPCYTQIHPTCIPQHGDYQSKLTLMSESLRNDGRIWVPLERGDARPASEIPETERDYYLERRYPAFGNLVPRDIASRAAKLVCDEGQGIGHGGRGVFLDFAEAIERLGRGAIEAKYGNLFEMYERITGENPYEVPMRIYPAPHYTMGGLWVDYNLMSTVAGLYVIGEANFSDHGANRLGASALMQGLADGYFVLPYTIGDYLARHMGDETLPTDHPAFAAVEEEVGDRLTRLLAVDGKRTVDSLHRELGKICDDYCGMSRNRDGLSGAIGKIQELREEYWQNVKVPGAAADLNQSLEKAGRVADYFELAELMCRDALAREESCGTHFREEYQTPEGEAQRNDEEYSHVSAWQWAGERDEPTEHREQLGFEHVPPSQRSYK